MAGLKHRFQAVTSNRNVGDLFACKWLRARATIQVKGFGDFLRSPWRSFIRSGNTLTAWAGSWAPKMAAMHCDKGRRVRE